MHYVAGEQQPTHCLMAQTLPVQRMVLGAKRHKNAASVTRY